MPTRSRFEGLKLDEGDRVRLKQMETGGARMSVRTWRRVRTLLLLDLGYTVTATAEAQGTYRRETARIGKRYLAGGLEHALGDDPRPKPPPLLDSTQDAAIVAMVCGPPPEGRARWTVRLVATEAVRRGITPSLDHGLKPWREKMWCVPEITGEFVDRMEDVLRLYGRKLDPAEPVVCLDERPVVLREDARRGEAMKAGKLARTDYEYVRCGTANIFCIVEPLTGRRLTFATPNRKSPAFVRALRKIAQRYRSARRQAQPCSVSSQGGAVYRSSSISSRSWPPGATAPRRSIA